MSSPIQQVVHQELAALGGHLLSTYGTPIESESVQATPQAIADAVKASHNPQLAALGGFLLEHYGKEDTAA